MSDTQPIRTTDARITLLDRVVGTIIVLIAVVAVVAARASVFLLPTMIAAAMTLVLSDRSKLDVYLQPSQYSIPLALLLMLAAVSAAWSAGGLATLTSVAAIMLVLLQWHVLNRWVWTQPGYRISHFAYWVPIAVLIGALVLMVEVLGDQHVRRMLIDNFGILTPPTLEKHWRIDAAGHSHIREFELNRSVAAANMFFWPAMLCARSWWSGRRFTIFAGALVVIVILTTMASRHETSKIAVIVGLLCFALAMYRLRWARFAARAGWVTLLVAVPFAAHIAYHNLNLHKAPWLQFSARERIVIWSDIATRVQEAPILGVGARTGYVLSNRNKQNLNPPTRTRAKAIARHAHNVYLQTWFELGLIGAALFLVAGLAVLRAISDLKENVQPFALATFSVFMIQIASTWEIWQRWYAALFALTAIFLAMGIRSMGGASASTTPATGASSQSR